MQKGSGGGGKVGRAGVPAPILGNERMLLYLVPGRWVKRGSGGSSTSTSESTGEVRRVARDEVR